MGIEYLNQTEKNTLINKYIKYHQISEEDKSIIANIPFIDYTYICPNCNNIPKIEIIYNENKSYIEKLYFKECNKTVYIQLKDNNFELRKCSLDSLYKINYMNINKKKNRFKDDLPFNTKDNFDEYIGVYKSYLKVREQIKKNNSGDTKKNEIFSFFEDLLFIGLYGFGTTFEYQNSIVIKEFTFDKFKRYNSEYFLNNNYSLIPYGNIRLYKSIYIKHLKNDLFAIQYYKGRNNLFYISKLNKDKDIFYKKYFKVDSYKNIPEEYHKNYLIYKEEKKFKDIVLIKENNYLISCKYENVLYNFDFDENTNNYNIYELVIMEFKEYQEIKKFYSLKNGNIVIITKDSIYIYKIGMNYNLECIKKYLNVNDEEFPELFNPDIIELQNGDFIFNYPRKIFYISKITYEIKCVINFNQYIYQIFAFKHKILVNYHYNENLYLFDTKCVKIIQTIYKKKPNLLFNLDNKIFAELDKNTFYLFDFKDDIIIYNEIFEYSYYLNNLNFTFIDKKECIFAIYSYNGNIFSLNIYQLKKNK